MTKEEILTEYEKCLRLRRLAVETQITYMSCVSVYLNWCEKEDVYPPQINKEKLRDFFITTESASYLGQMSGTLNNLYDHVGKLKTIINWKPLTYSHT